MEKGLGHLGWGGGEWGRGHSDLLSHKHETNYRAFRSSQWTAFKASLKTTAPASTVSAEPRNESVSLLQSALVKKPVSKDNNVADCTGKYSKEMTLYCSVQTVV